MPGAPSLYDRFGDYGIMLTTCIVRLGLKYEICTHVFICVRSGSVSSVVNCLRVVFVLWFCCFLFRFMFTV